ncbi:hypothetical protein CSQ85_11995 [Bifidobacterium rousetti]|uniref:hypothetical protein n=1 Tax=Bifidobacterium rousetti TaxID=2045439 RepID=UPI00123AC147|nr:hypothetical protein [Bifidobacterium rousetti]KAA8816139.1 hypothetical protein CSQ85_11995 [Bifidobacterium rousetti]
MNARRITGIVTTVVGFTSLTGYIAYQWESWPSHLLMYQSILTHLPSSLMNLPAHVWVTPLPVILSTVILICGILAIIHAGPTSRHDPHPGTSRHEDKRREHKELDEHQMEGYDMTGIGTRGSNA